jgi:outer membrane receptor for ferrienterochelin and colicins
MVVSLSRTFAFALVVVSAAQAAAQNGTITGRVTNAEDGQPIPEATVFALARTGTAVDQAYTDQNGRFSLVVSSGTYSVSAKRVSFSETTVSNVVVPTGGTIEVTLTMTMRAQQLERVVSLVGGVQQKALDVPGTSQTITATVVEETPSVQLLDALRGRVPGLHFPQHGLQSGTPVVRGFNNVFSGALLMINDYRFATVPSLRVNTPYMVPTTNEDVSEMQVLLGPASALYGPNAANGVLHVITKSPFESQGTTVSVGGGERSAFRVGLRHAGAPTEKFGYKISGQFLRADDWRYTDPAETIARDFDLERWSGEARLDFRPTKSMNLVTSVGRTEAGNALEMTGIGTAQAKDWSYTYYQARFSWKRLFLQTFLNQSDTKDTYLLRTGQRIIDKSRVIASQAQNVSVLGSRQTFTYGVDFQHTQPQTNGTINGRNEGDDNISEIGGYLQWQANLSPMFDLTLAGRVDDHSRLDEPVYSPRAALMFKPTEGQTFRLTYNRAFSTPTPNNLFLDLVAARIPRTGPVLLHEIRTLGVPQSGFQFGRNCPTGAGSLCMRQSPLLAQLGGADPSAVLAAEATRTWRGVIELLIAQGQPATLRGIPQPGPTQVQSVLALLNPTTGVFSPATADLVRDVDALRPSITNTYEAGYNGLIAKTVRLAADVYYEKRNDFVGPLIVETPNIFYDSTSLHNYLTPFVGPANAGALAEAVSQIPVGTVTPINSALTNDSDLILTYRNFGDLDRWGADFSLEASLGIESPWSIIATYSWANKDLWPRSEVGGVSDVALNSPSNQGSLGVRYSEGASRGLTVDVRGRYSDAFPMNSGVFVGPVESFTVVDASIAYRFPFAKRTVFSVNASNVLDKKHREVFGAPEIGRFVMTQVQVTF